MQVRGSCLWWQPERDGWEEGPKVKIIMRMRMISMILRKMVYLCKRVKIGILTLLSKKTTRSANVKCIKLYATVLDIKWV